MNKTSFSSKIYRFMPRLLKRLEFIAKVPGRKYLDFGCGSGIVLRQNLFIRPELEVSAVDINDFSKDLPERVEFKAYNGKNLPFDDCQFEIVTANHVFEHIPDPDKLLLEVFRVMSPGGYFYIETPGIRALQKANTLKRFAGCVDFYDDPTHLQPFSPDQLREIGIRCGFEIVESGIARNWLHLILSPLLLLAGLCRPKSLMFMYGRNALLGWASYAVFKKPG